MTTWLSSILGMTPFRNSLRNGRALFSQIRPNRFPWLASTSVSASTTPSGHNDALTNTSQHESELEAPPPLPPNPELQSANPNTALSSSFETVGARRSIWSSRGGDDRKWSFMGQLAQKNQLANTSDMPVAKIQTNLSPTAYLTSVCTTPGFRPNMEDEFFLSMEADFAAVFDGHGGRAVSRYLRKNLYNNVQSYLLTNNTSPTNDTAESGLGIVNSTESTSSHKTSPLHPTKPAPNTTDYPGDITDQLFFSVPDYKSAIQLALQKVDREVQRIHHWSFQGSTAVAIWLHEYKPQSKEHSDIATDSEQQVLPSQKTIIAANVGDCRAVLCRNNTAWELTRDHKPTDPTERARIEECGGTIVWCGEKDLFDQPVLDQGVYRINGNLAVSRTIGDRAERPYVTADSEIIAVPLHEGDSFVVLASDGLWDVLGSAEVVDYIQSFLVQGHKHEEIATLVVQEALGHGAYDNITVVIVWLHKDDSKVTT